MTQYMNRAYCIHAIRGKHLSRARRRTIQQQSHQILGCSTTGSCNHCRVVFKFHSLRHHIFLEHFARTRRYSDLCPNQCRWLNEPDRTLGKSRQIKPEVGTLWGWYFTKMAHASELRAHNDHDPCNMMRGLPIYSRLLSEIFLISAAELSRLPSLGLSLPCTFRRLDKLKDKGCRSSKAKRSL
jgi:hypothetical protein